MLLLSAVAIMPVFGATTGVVSLDKAFIAPGAGNVVTVTVTDGDLNVANAGNTQVLATSGTGLAGVAQTFRLTGVTGTEELVVSSLADDSSAHFVTGGFQAVGTSFVAVIPDVTETASTDVTVTYSKATPNSDNTLVRVTSPLDSTGIVLVMTETAADTGIFTGTFTVSEDVSSTQVQALAGMDVTVTYSDGDPAGKRTAKVRVEKSAPVGSLTSPAHDATTTSQTPTLAVQFTDTDSGLVAGGIQTTTWVTSANTSSNGTSVDALTLTLDTITTEAITDGFSASRKITAGIPDGQTSKIEWKVTATDKAGNPGSTKASATVTDYILVIDRQKPDFSGASTARTGAWYDAVAKEVVNGAEADGDEGKSLNTSIGIKMSDVFPVVGANAAIEESLNAGTVTGADFDIDNLKLVSGVVSSNVTPSAALVPVGDSNWIFLTVPAMAPDATPSITLTTTAGGISDTAGNAQDTGSIAAATDQIAPTLTVTMDKILDTDKATLTISTDERITANPVVTHSKTADAGSAVGVTVTTTGVNQWSAVVDPADDGAYSIQVAVADSNVNAASKGSNTAGASGFPAAGDLALYIDSSLLKATVTPANGASAEIADPFFITVNFAAEAADLGANDAHKTVTVTSITLDGSDISSLLDPQGASTSFDLAKAGIATGEHTLVVNAVDSAGNEVLLADRTTKFTVTARKAYDVAMTAGWNLISLPGEPVAGALDSVLPASHPATDILSFDDGAWTVATRTAGGTWEGTLTALDGKHGYWVFTSSSEKISTLLSLASVGSAATLPTIALESNWNLISVIDLAQAKQGESAATQTAGQYLTSVSWSVGYTYDSGTRTWSRVTDAAGNVSNGQGVWVWATKAGTLIP